MRGRVIVIGTVVGALVLFVWQSLSHGVLGLPENGLREFPNDSGTAAAAHAIRAMAPQNAVYFSRYGAFAAVHISADYADRTKQFGSMMAKQAAIDLAMVFVLVLLLDRLAGGSVWRTATTYAALALAYAGGVHVSNWVWWNFPLAWTIGNVADQMIGFLLVGLTIAALRRRMEKPDGETAERQGVKAGAGLGGTLGVGVRR
ncbi:MAG TPA: hypothetical protein VFI80_04915 [Burkholderiales bacterium]|nr:hypothetical protein [Burkholderiales bacterium]